MVSFSGIFSRTYPLWWLLVSPEDSNTPIITHCSVFHCRALLKVLNPEQGSCVALPPTPCSACTLQPSSPSCTPHAGHGAERGCWGILTWAHSQRGEAGARGSTTLHLSVGALRAATSPGWSASLDSRLCWLLGALLSTDSLWGVWMPSNSSSAFQEQLFFFFLPLIVLLQD